MKLKVLALYTHTGIYKTIKNDRNNIKINKGVLYAKTSKHN